MTQFGVLAGFGSVVLGMLMAFLSLFLIMLILLQRGRGGGLSGALGGAGGQSAFGSKAGDTFTVLTVSLAGVWILVCAFAMWSLGMHVPTLADNDESSLSPGPGSDAEDIAGGLVIPTTDGEDDPSDMDRDAELVPAEVSSEAGFESPAEMTEAAPATEAPATEAPESVETPTETPAE